MQKGGLTRSSGNVFVDLGFPPEEAAVLAIRTDLIARLRKPASETAARRPSTSVETRVALLLPGQTLL